MEDVNHTAQSSQSVEDEPEDGGDTRAGVGRGSRRGVTEDHKTERSRDSFPLEEAEQMTIGDNRCPGYRSESRGLGVHQSPLPGLFACVRIY